MTYVEIAELVIAAQNGNNNAFSKIFEATHNQMYYYAVKVVGEDSAEDVLQNSYISLIKNIKSLSDPMAFVGWFKKIVYRECIAINKKNGRYILSNDDEENIFETLEDENTEFLPPDAFANVEKRQIVLDAIDRLPDAQKQTILMFYFDELSIRQIAEIMDINENTVKSNLNYGRTKLAKSLGEKKSKHMLSAAPLLLFILRDSSTAYAMTGEQSEGLLSGVLRVTGVSLAAGSGVGVAAGTTAVSTAAGVSAEAVAGTATTATSAMSGTAISTATTGIIAKVAATTLATKIIATVAAGAIVIGAIGGVKTLNDNYFSQQTGIVVSTDERTSKVDEEGEEDVHESQPLEESDLEPEERALEDAEVEETDSVEDNLYAGAYRCIVSLMPEERIKITITEDGRLQLYGEDIDINNIQEDGSILVYEKPPLDPYVPNRMYIYPAGVELSVFDYRISAEAMVDTDASRVRILQVLPEGPDNMHFVYYKVEPLQADEPSYLPETNVIYEFSFDAMYFGRGFFGVQSVEYIDSDGDLIVNVVEDYLKRYVYSEYIDSDGKVITLTESVVEEYLDGEHVNSISTPVTTATSYYEDATGLYLCTGEGEYADSLLIKYPLVAGDKFQNSGDYGNVKVESINETVTTEAGAFEDVVVVRYGRDREDDWSETRYYAPGVGLIKYEEMHGSGELIKIIR